MTIAQIFDDAAAKQAAAKASTREAHKAALRAEDELDWAAPIRRPRRRPQRSAQGHQFPSVPTSLPQSGS